MWGKWAVRVSDLRREMGHLIAQYSCEGNAGCRTQNVGVGMSPTPTYSSGEPPGTRTPNPLIKRQWICPLRLSADVRRCPSTPKPPQLLTSLIPELSGLVHSYSPSWLSVWLSRRFFIPAILEGAADRLD